MREIRRYQQSTELLLPKAAFSRVVREVMTDIKGERRYANAGYSWQRSALGALQEATEAFLTRFFEGKTIAPNPFLLF